MLNKPRGRHTAPNGANSDEVPLENDDEAAPNGAEKIFSSEDDDETAEEQRVREIQELNEETRQAKLYAPLFYMPARADKDSRNREPEEESYGEREIEGSRNRAHEAVPCEDTEAVDARNRALSDEEYEDDDLQDDDETAKLLDL